jgi:hypothetical protein
MGARRGGISPGRASSAVTPGAAVRRAKHRLPGMMPPSVAPWAGRDRAPAGILRSRSYQQKTMTEICRFWFGTFRDCENFYGILAYQHEELMGGRDGEFLGHRWL